MKNIIEKQKLIIENNINHNKNQPITLFFNASSNIKNKIISYLTPSDALNCLKTSHLFARAIQTSHILYQNLSPQNLISFKNNQYKNHFQNTQKIPKISIKITSIQDFNDFISILNDMNVRILHIDTKTLNFDDPQNSEQFQNFLIQHKPLSILIYCLNSSEKLEKFISYFSHITTSITIKLIVLIDEIDRYVKTIQQLPENTRISKIDLIGDLTTNHIHAFNNLLSLATNLESLLIENIWTEKLKLPTTINTFLFNNVNAPLSLHDVKSISKLYIKSLNAPISNLPNIINEFTCNKIAVGQILDLTSPKIISKLNIGNPTLKNLKIKLSNLSYSSYFKIIWPILTENLKIKLSNLSYSSYFKIIWPILTGHILLILTAIFVISNTSQKHDRFTAILMTLIWLLGYLYLCLKFPLNRIN